MQIIPTSSSAAAIFTGITENANNNSGFMDAMTDALSAVQDEDNFSASSAMPVVESPYVRHSTDGVTYTLSEVCFTKQELQELREQLLKEGAPAETLGKLEILADQPDGATLAQVMASLINQGADIQLSEDDAHAITALLGQIDPSGQLATDALGFMQNGQRVAALDLIQNALASMGADETITVDAEGMLALGRGLGLNQDNLKGLLASFAGRDSLTVNSAQFDILMNPAKNQLMAEAANMEKLDAALEKTLKPIISKARDRMEKEKAASELQNRRADQSRVLIDKTVQERSREILDETAAGSADKNIGKQSDIIGNAGKNESNARANADSNRHGMFQQDSRANPRVENSYLQEPADAKTAAKNAENIKNVTPADKNGKLAVEDANIAAGEPVPSEDGLQFMTVNKDGGAADSSLFNQGQNDAWQNLLDKVNISPVSSRVDAATPVFNPLWLGENFAQPPLADKLAGANSQLSAQLASQVEKGMLTAMRDGATRLDLQLHPAELGPVSITLIARNGEVTAQIKSERTETADMINRQVDIIRVNLEQQGVKVDKIEVQLQNRDSNGENSFQNLDQHNARQEQDAYRQEVIRLRNLASMRNNSENSNNDGLAQSMHIKGQQARYAGQALHVVA